MGTFTQNVTYYLMNQETNLSGLSDKEIMKGFFVIPFETDSFTYSISLVQAMNWSTFILVDYVFPGQPETPAPAPAPTMAPTATATKEDTKLTNGAVYAISVSMPLAACIIVLFLLWDRKHKVDPNAMTYADRRSFTSSIGAQQLPLPLSSEQRKQVCGDDTSASLEYDMPGLPMEYNYSINRPDFTDAVESAINNSNNNTDKRNLASSIRSAPPMSMLRTLSDFRRQVSGEGRLYKSPITSGKNHQNVSSNHKGVVAGTSSRSNSSSGGDRTSSPTSSKNSVRHGLPPLPPPLPIQHPASSYSPHTHFEHVTVVGEGEGEDGDNNKPLTANFRRPSRPGFAMRMSSITNSSITDISFMSDAFPSDREFVSEDFMPPEFPPPRPHNHLDNLEQQSEAFSSPLHLPYEESTPDIRVLLDHRSHHTPPESPTIPAILDMTSTSSLPQPLPLPPTENTTLTPVVMAGFDMKIQDIE